MPCALTWLAEGAAYKHHWYVIMTIAVLAVTCYANSAFTVPQEKKKIFFLCISHCFRDDKHFILK